MGSEKQAYFDSGAPPPYPGQGGPSGPAYGYGYGPAPPSYAAQVPPGGYYAAAPSYPQNVPPTTTTTVYIAAPMMLGPAPISMQCPKCGNQIVTETATVAGGMTYLICVIIALLGGWLGCCMIPFCIDECQDVEHRCPSCKNYLGMYRRM